MSQLATIAAARLRQHATVRSATMIPDSFKFRHFSTSEKEELAKTPNLETEQQEASSSSTSSISNSTLLYKANSSKATLPRAILAFSTLHTGYWSWYVLDFTPALTASAADPSSIDPTVGYLGLGLSVFMFLGSILYPKSLISEISRNENQHKLQIKTFNLPFVLPSRPIEYKLGELVIDSPNDVTKILSEYNGDMAKFPGHMALHAEGKYTNLLMNMKEDAGEEITDKKLLLQSLLPGQRAPILVAKNGKGQKATADPQTLKPLKLNKKMRMKHKSK